MKKKHEQIAPTNVTSAFEYRFLELVLNVYSVHTQSLNSLILDALRLTFLCVCVCLFVQCTFMLYAHCSLFNLISISVSVFDGICFFVCDGDAASAVVVQIS